MELLAQIRQANFLQPAVDRPLQLLHRVELGEIRRPVVVEVGEPPLLDLLDQHPDLHRRPGLQTAAAAAEAGGEVDGIAGRAPGQTVVQAVQQPVGPQLVEQVGGGEGGQLPALAPAVDVEDRVVALEGRALHRLQLGEVIQIVLQMALRIFGIHLRRAVQLEAAPFVFRRLLEGRPDGHPHLHLDQAILVSDLLHLGGGRR